MSHPSLPDLSSFSQALQVTIALGLVLTYAGSVQGRIKSSPRASRALLDLRAKTLRFQAELELMQKAKDEAIAVLDKSGDEFALALEDLSEHIATFRASVVAVERAALSLDRSLVEALTYDAIYQASIPEWKPRTRELRQVLTDTREMIVAQSFTAGLDKVEAEVGGLVQRANAAEGLTEWGRSSSEPSDEELLDPNEGTPVSWDSKVGWH